MAPHLAEFLLKKSLYPHVGMRNLVKKYEPPRSDEVAVLKQKLERCHSSDLALNAVT